MEAGQQFLSDVREAVLEVAPEDRLLVEKIDIYLGLNPLARCPIMSFQIRACQSPLPIQKLRKLIEAQFHVQLEPMALPPRATGSHKAASLAAAAAAALLNRELGIGTSWGVRPHRDGSADSWIELLLGAPAGPALKATMMAVAAIIGKRRLGDDPVGQQLSILRRLCSSSQPNPMSAYLIDAARANDLPYLSLGRSKRTWQFGWGSRGRIFSGAACNDDGLVAFNIAKYKLNAKHVLHELGLPTPRWQSLAPDEDPAKAIPHIGWPCVVKPVDSSWGDGVTTNICSMTELHAAVSFARGNPPRKLMIEGCEPGSDHRLMVIEGRLFAAARLDPATVTGDGRSSVRQLVQRLNRKRLGPMEETGFLSPIMFDQDLLFRLQSLDLSLDAVLPNGTVLVLRSAANRSAGGSVTDVTAQVHPKIRCWAEQLAATIGLRVAGIDYMSEDISRDPAEIGGGFIEVNATPGLQVLSAAGLDRVAIGTAILGREPDRIPVDLVLTGSENIDKVILGLDREARHAIAWPHGAEIGGTPIAANGLTPFEIVGAVLRHRSVDRCTIVWTCDDMCLFGLPVDRLRRTTLFCAKPGGDWLELLEQISQSVVTSEETTPRMHIAAEPV
ncbi:hypothetical protein [Sphingosinicella rhizophila]|uniref:ATP-grasp domain-containing protein n=1 Tax=Sphingosinicella rhizophila TaxID=3050082 RepID=A0ABU3Q7A3_9SPHN|nr:hypothetical protein [Sphingosinicella sp. GR2756]MDT9598984.1 hypothetical protein [Sphingosinicella sp. GR2756]